MVVELCAAACEVALGAATALADVAAMVVMASVRPWRYALSPSYRRTECEKLSHRGVAFKIFYFAWGSAVLVASIALVTAAAWWISGWKSGQDALVEERRRAALETMKGKAFELKEGLGR